MGPPGLRLRGRAFRLGVIVNRTVFLDDGFYMWHSVRECERVLRRLGALDVVAP